MSTFMRILSGVIVFILLFVTSYYLSDYLRELKCEKDDNPDNTGVLVSSLFFLITLATAVILCVEMFINNPHESIYLQICCNIEIYALACVFGFHDKESAKLQLIFTVLFMLIGGLMLPISAILPLPTASELYKEYDGKEFSVVREVVEARDILSANDAYSVSGSGSIGIFAINTNGCYRYYYRAEDGAIEQGEIDTANGDKLYDDCTENGASPSIAIVRSYEGHYVVHNKKVTKYIEPDSLKVWKELHVPEGSIAYNFAFDLQ